MEQNKPDVSGQNLPWYVMSVFFWSSDYRNLVLHRCGRGTLLFHRFQRSRERLQNRFTAL